MCAGKATRITTMVTSGCGLRASLMDSGIQTGRAAYVREMITYKLYVFLTIESNILCIITLMENVDLYVTSDV